MIHERVIMKTFNRDKILWEDSIYELTPVQQIGDIYYKREDLFAPAGEGLLNGSKARQCLWLINEYMKQDTTPKGIITGTVLKSPQHLIVSSIARHYGIPSVHIVGGTNPNSAIKVPNIRISNYLGAKFDFKCGTGYNSSLQKRTKELNRSEYPSYFYVEYGITLNHKLHSADRIEQFHRVGAEQVKNIPDNISTIIIPFGSGNSTTSILYGLSLYKPKNLKKVILVGIGPEKIDYVEERLDVIKSISNVENKNFKRNYIHNKEKENKYNALNLNIPKENTDYDYELVIYDLHSTGVYKYSDSINYVLEDGTKLHGTYEAKVMTWARNNIPEDFNQGTLFWIVGSEANINEIEPNILQELGEEPNAVTLR